jgi:hypothetical protein
VTNLLWTLQRCPHDILSTSHDRMLHRCEEIPAPASDAHREAQKREHLEQQIRIRLHPSILPVAQLPFVSVVSRLVFSPPNRVRQRPRTIASAAVWCNAC